MNKQLLKVIKSPYLFILAAVLVAALIDFAPHFLNRTEDLKMPTASVLASIAPIPATTSELETTQITRVIDGDTIVVSGNRTVRLIGMNTPETVDPRKPVECFGKEASNFTKSLLPEGTTVQLEKDVSETDKYGRLLRFVYRDGVFVNQLLVNQGYAQVMTIPPDVKYSELFLSAQQDAKDNNRGLWSKCN